MGVNVISGKWVFTGKLDEHGDTVQGKSSGWREFTGREKRVGYSDTDALTPASACILTAANIACEMDLDFCHFDEQQAFVQSNLEDTMFMRLPEGCGSLLLTFGFEVWGFRLILI